MSFQANILKCELNKVQGCVVETNQPVSSCNLHAGLIDAGTAIKRPIRYAQVIGPISGRSNVSLTFDTFTNHLTGRPGSGALGRPPASH